MSLSTITYYDWLFSLESTCLSKQKTKKNRRTQKHKMEHVLPQLNAGQRHQLETLVRNIEDLVYQKRAAGIFKSIYCINCRCTPIPCTHMGEDSFINLPWCPSETMLSVVHALSAANTLLPHHGANYSVVHRCLDCSNNFCCEEGINSSYPEPTEV